jgi:hypothetical protein
VTRELSSKVEREQVATASRHLADADALAGTPVN